MKQHPLVGQYSIDAFLNNTYDSDVKLWLGFARSRAFPDQFKVERDENGSYLIKHNKN